MGKKCSHCKVKPASEKWTMDLCAMGDVKLEGHLCVECDIMLNERIMVFFNVPDTADAMQDYAIHMRGEANG